MDKLKSHFIFTKVERSDSKQVVLKTTRYWAEGKK